MEHESFSQRISVAAAIVLLLFTATGNAELMLVLSGIAVAVGLLFFTGKLKSKVILPSVVAIAVVILIARAIVK